MLKGGYATGLRLKTARTTRDNDLAKRRLPVARADWDANVADVLELLRQAGNLDLNSTPAPRRALRLSHCPKSNLEAAPSDTNITANRGDRAAFALDLLAPAAGNGFQAPSGRKRGRKVSGTF